MEKRNKNLQHWNSILFVKTDFEFEFGYLPSVGIGYRFEPKKK